MPAKAGLLLALCGAAGLFAYALTGMSGSAQAACANPVGYAGDQIYNATSKVMQYCNAADKWIPMWGNSTGGSSGSSVSECEENGGKVVGGACWFLGASSESCTTVCTSRNGYNSATLSYAGSGGSNANCGAVLDALGGLGTGASSDVANALGCSTTMLGARSRGTTATTEAASSTNRRACACNYSVNSAAACSMSVANSVTSGTYLDEVIDMTTDESGDYMYALGKWSNTLVGFNITNPANITYVSHTADNTNLHRAGTISVKGGYAYVTLTDNAAIKSYAVNNGTIGALTGTLAITGKNSNFDSEIVGNYLYVTSMADHSFNSINISTPSMMMLTGQAVNATHMGGAAGFEIVGNYAFVAASTSNKLAVVNISNPASMLVVANTTGTSMTTPYDVAIKGNYAFVTGFASDSLTAFNISNPMAPTEIGKIVDAVALNGAGRVVIEGNTAYVTNAEGDNVTAVDISNPAAMSVQGTVTAPGMDYMRGIVFAKDHVFAASFSGDTIFSLTNCTATGGGGGGGANLISDPPMNIASGALFSCAIGTDNKAYCWGLNSSYQLGDGTNVNKNVPTLVLNGEGTGTYKKVEAGNAYTCGLGLDNKAYCWGLNSSYQLGDSTSVNKNAPVLALNGAGPGTYKQISLGHASTYGIGSDDKIYHWGWFNSGNITSPTLLGKGTGTDTYLQVSAGNQFACGIGSDNKAYCWGNTSFGGLGDGVSTNSNVPVTVLTGAGPGTYKQISVGYDYACAIGTDDKAYCWGLNSTGQLGDNTTVNKSSPTLVLNGEGPGTYKQISSGLESTSTRTTCAIGTDDKMYCWGGNITNQIGDGTTTQRNTPVLTLNGVGPGTYKSIARGSSHTCAIASDNKAYCWGSGSSGQVGHGSFGTATTPALAVNGEGPGTYRDGSSGGGGSGTETCTGDAWTPSPMTGQWGGVAFGNNTFVALGQDGTTRVKTSPDGKNWTPQSVPDQEWMSVRFLNGKFMAISGTSDHVITSTDGITWTPFPIPVGVSQWLDIAYGNNIYVAVGNSGAASSLNGETWTLRSIPSSGGNVAFGNGVFVSVDGSSWGATMSSTNGTSWTYTSAHASNVWADIAFGNGVFVAVAPNNVMTSTNGTSWNLATSIPAGAWWRVTYTGGLFIATTMSGEVMVSTDGTSWSAKTSPAGSSWMRAAHGDGKIVGVSGFGTEQVMISQCSADGSEGSSSISSETRCNDADGEYTNGACWFLGEAGKSCAGACDDVFGLYDDATLSVGGSGASDNTACTAILNALSAPGTGSATGVANANGCHVNVTTRRRGTTATTDVSAGAGIRRACACKVGGDDLGNHTATEAINMNNNRIINLGVPSANTDIATKAYVDALTGGTETDPQIGTLTADKWCSVSGGAINCTENAPGGTTSQQPDTAVAVYQKPQGEEGGTPVVNTWTTYPFNRLKQNSAGAFLVNNGLQLAAGTYYIDAVMTFAGTDTMSTRLMSSLSGTPVLFGMSGYINDTTPDVGKAYLRGIFTLSAQATVSIQYYVNNADSSTGLGAPLNQGTEVYGTVYVEKVN